MIKGNVNLGEFWAMGFMSDCKYIDGYLEGDKLMVSFEESSENHLYMGPIVKGKFHGEGYL